MPQRAHRTHAEKGAAAAVVQVRVRRLFVGVEAVSVGLVALLGRSVGRSVGRFVAGRRAPLPPSLPPSPFRRSSSRPAPARHRTPPQKRQAGGVTHFCRGKYQLVGAGRRAQSYADSGVED